MRVATRGIKSAAAPTLLLTSCRCLLSLVLSLQRAKLEQDEERPVAIGGAGLGLAMLLPLTILGAALGSGYIK